jgi:phage terminase small subunit
MPAPSKIQTRPRTKPTYKQKRFVAEYIRTNGNGTEAAMRSYNVKSRNIAKNISHENIEKPVVQNEIQEALKRSKLTPDYVMDKLHDAVNSGLGVQAKNSDSIKGIDLLLKLYNAYPGKQSISKNISLRYSMSLKTTSEAMAKLTQLSQNSASLLSELK